ncbi:hypothetical protein FSP39_020931 [Pinctada imbricata]|uniref:Uncharacterized protein n=1 Tax=Pinctada imbricata TaxID=66713 RepID=A0AA88YL41_PINIB|nr:hypothetical protein FSP39_020931 [Pinctada imbricata]
MLGDGPASPETRTLNLEEGSGEDETVLDVDNKQPPKLTIIDDSPSLSDNDTLTEGSGGYAIEIETTTDFEEATTSLPVTHAPIVKTTPGPIKIQDTTIKSTEDPKTTVYSTEPLAITTKSKTVSETTPMKLTTQTTEAPTTTTTTSQEGIININDKGIIITHTEIVESEDDTGVDIFPEDVSTKKNEQLHHPNSGFDKTTPVPYSGNLAAQKVQNKKMGDQTVGNGVDSKADKKHDIGIYDEIGRDPIVKKRPPSDVITPKQVDDVYAVPDKTKKKSASPKVATQLDRIKFIDETTDEELDAKEGDKLIEGGKERTGSQASIPNGKVRHSSEMEDESTPMIKSSNDKDFSSQTKLDRSYSEESQPIMSNEEIDQILSSEKGNETKPEAV